MELNLFRSVVTSERPILSCETTQSMKGPVGSLNNVAKKASISH